MPLPHDSYAPVYRNDNDTFLAVYIRTIKLRFLLLPLLFITFYRYTCFGFLVFE
jgi:hypothetical protein